MNFRDVYENIKNDSPSLILGNGFGKGLFQKTNDGFNLSYTNIRDRVKTETQITEIKEFLESNKKHSDLEYLIKMMDYASTSLPFISPTYYHLSDFNETIARINGNKNSLKSITLEQFKKLHPDYSAELEPHIQNCSHFLKSFNKIFTFNYDLILYWIILTSNKFIHNENGKKNHFKDGFCKSSIKNLLEFRMNYNDFNVMFLHGAIHLIIDKDKIYKIFNQDRTTLTLNYLIPKLLEEFKNYDNFMVFEGTTEEKEKVIFSNAYLQKCMAKIDKIDAPIVIYGCSILDKDNEINNDKHIWKKILQSKAPNLFVSINKTYDSNEFKIKQKFISDGFNTISGEQQNNRLIFFSTESNDIWASYQ